MNDIAENTEGTEGTEKKEKVLLDIINGRMPLALVYLIRFEETAEKDAELATKYKTSNGKISDIRKNRNFGYVTEDMDFAQADIDAARAYLEKATLKGNTFSSDEVDSITSMLDTLPVSDEAASKITEARKAARKSKEAAPAEGEGEGEGGAQGEASDPNDLDI